MKIAVSFLIWIAVLATNKFNMSFALQSRNFRRTCLAPLQRVSKLLSDHEFATDYLLSRASFRSSSKSGPHGDATVWSEAKQRYLELLADPDARIIVVVGPAGTGKTMGACHQAIADLREGAVDQIVVTKPLITVDNEQIGFLPGGVQQKVAPWIAAILKLFPPCPPITKRKTKGSFGGDQKNKSEKKWTMEGMVETHGITFTPLGFMRGHTFHNSFVIADEMQNSTPMQMKMLLTRIGKDTRMVVIGDIDQQDRGVGSSSPPLDGLSDILQKLRAAGTDIANHIHVVVLEERDVCRDPLVKEILSLYSGGKGGCNSAVSGGSGGGSGGGTGAIAPVNEMFENVDLFEGEDLDEQDAECGDKGIANAISAAVVAPPIAASDPDTKPKKGKRYNELRTRSESDASMIPIHQLLRSSGRQDEEDSWAS